MKLQLIQNWRCEYEYPGFYQWTSPTSPICITATPFHEGIEGISVEVSNDKGIMHMEVIPFQGEKNLWEQNVQTDTATGQYHAVMLSHLARLLTTAITENIQK